MEKVSSLIIQIDIALRKIAAEKSQDGKNPFSLRSKALFLLSNGFSSPSDLISELCINKSNLAALTKELEKDGLIFKQKLSDDRREISLSITPSGKEYLDSCFFLIENWADLTFGEDYSSFLDKLTQALRVLEFI